jgi:cytochrome P450
VSLDSEYNLVHTLRKDLWMTRTQELYDPFDHAVQDDPYPIYRTLREDHPVYRCVERNSWVLSRYVDVDAALVDPETYCSSKGIFPTREGHDQTADILPMMIMMDPPQHTELRHLVRRVFTPNRVDALDGVVRATADELLAPLQDASSCDLVRDLAGPLPAMVMADLLGVPRADRDTFRAWSSAFVQGGPSDLDGDSPSLAAAASLYEYFAGFIAERRRSPREDLITALVQSSVDGRRLSEEELLGFCLLLLVAGHETTTNLLSNAVVVLAENAKARDRLAAEEALIPAGVEELLRYDSPVQGLGRTLTRDVTLHGTTMSAGDTVLLLYGSANRDDDAFPDADRFDIDRQPERQVAFGRGIHFCLGAALARLEARILLPEILRRMPSLQPDLARAQRLRSGPIRGYSSLPVSW